MGGHEGIKGWIWRCIPTYHTSLEWNSVASCLNGSTFWSREERNILIAIASYRMSIYVCIFKTTETPVFGQSFFTRTIPLRNSRLLTKNPGFPLIFPINDFRPEFSRFYIAGVPGGGRSMSGSVALGLVPGSIISSSMWPPPKPGFIFGVSSTTTRRLLRRKSTGLCEITNQILLPTEVQSSRIDGASVSWNNGESVTSIRLIWLDYKGTVLFT